MHDAVSPTIVVVDDDLDALEFICDLITEMGLVPVGVQDSSRALSVIAQAHPRVIILDVDMPGIDGIELFDQLRADEGTRTIPVIFFTASAEFFHRRLINYKARGVRLVAKPDVVLLHQTVQSTLETAEAV